jgi:DNA-binding response OmpR family regulator
MKILVAADDKHTASILAEVLTHQNYAVEIAQKGQTVRELIEYFPYDLIVVDASLPDLDGINLCQQIRTTGKTLPILLLTQSTSPHDGVAGLNAGADDYFLKPIEPEELLARVRALLRRGSNNSLPVLEWKDLKLDPSTYTVTYAGQPLVLTPKEYALLELFLRNPRRVFSCGAILDRLWEFEKIPGENAVRTHIKELRHKLKAIGAPADAIETVYGMGYRLTEKETNSSLTKETNHNQQAKQQTISALAGVWSRYQGRIHEQIDIIEQAATAFLKTNYPQEIQERSEQEAHTLAGTLGTFGLTKGSQLARNIEYLLETIRIWEQKEVLRLQELVQALRYELDRASQNPVSEAEMPPDDRPFLLIVDRDRQLSELLIKEAENWGMKASSAIDIVEARKQIKQKAPDLLLLEPLVSQTSEDGFKFIAELTHQIPPIPVSIFTAQDSLQERLEVVRSGGCAFLQKPMPPAQVLKAITQILHRSEPSDAKVMVIDDDPKILAILRSLLEPWGLKVTALEDSRRFWETLEAVAPDLLILDLKMPHINGIELCQIIRNDAQWGGLPIIFLTGVANPKLVERVFAAGADDFVSKPVVGPELVARILNRLERLKLLQRLASDREVRNLSIEENVSTSHLYR